MSVDSYSTIAPEYYNELAHPTCSNFRFLSEQFLGTSLLSAWSESPPCDAILEVGAGRSLVAPLLDRISVSTSGLTLQDISEAMLEHSREWFPNAQYLISDARRVPLPNASQSLIVSSLGDPYNDEAFLSEVRRLLRPGGHFMITAPSEAWASAFRSNEHSRAAEFVLLDGRSHYVPSITWDPVDYIRAAETRGFKLREFKAFQSSDIQGFVSPKLRVGGYFGAVLDGYWFQASAI